MSALKAPQIRVSYCCSKTPSYSPTKKDWNFLIFFSFQLVDIFGIQIRLQVKGSVDWSPRIHSLIYIFLSGNRIYSLTTAWSKTTFIFLFSFINFFTFANNHLINNIALNFFICCDALQEYIGYRWILVWNSL